MLFDSRFFASFLLMPPDMIILNHMWPVWRRHTWTLIERQRWQSVKIAQEAPEIDYTGLPNWISLFIWYLNLNKVRSYEKAISWGSPLAVLLSFVRNVCFHFGHVWYMFRFALWSIFGIAVFRQNRRHQVDGYARVDPPHLSDTLEDRIKIQEEDMHKKPTKEKNIRVN